MNLEKSTVISVVVTLFPLSNHTVIIQFPSVLFYFIIIIIIFHFLFLFLLFLFFLSLLLFLHINLFLIEFKFFKLDLYSDVQFYLFRAIVILCRT